VHAEPLWEPAATVVGHYLAPWIAYRHPELGHPAPVPARRPVAGLEVDARLSDPTLLGLDPYEPRLPSGEAWRRPAS
jgi:hypothetical protein